MKKLLLPALAAIIAGCATAPQGPSLREQADAAFLEAKADCKDQTVTALEYAECVEPSRRAILRVYGWNEGQIQEFLLLDRVLSQKIDAEIMTSDEAALVFLKEYRKVQEAIDARIAQRDAEAQRVFGQAISSILSAPETVTCTSNVTGTTCQ